MLQLYLHRMAMLIGLIVAMILLLCYRKRLWPIYVVLVIVFCVGLFIPNPVRNNALRLRYQLMVQLYETKYVGKNLAYARAELGAPISILSKDDLLVWEYEYLMVVSHDCRTVAEVQMPSGGSRH